MATINTNEVLTTKEAASLLRVTVDTVKKYCQIGRIKAINVGRQWLIPKAEITRYNKERRDYNKAD